MRQLVTDYRAGLVVGILNGFTGGVTILGTILFLCKYWL
jgi:hypothetical protein